MMHKVLLWLLIPSVFIGLVYGYLFYQNKQKMASIHSFKDCQNAGFPILESYPPQCMTSDKRVFTEDIGNALEYRDEIIVDSPTPGQLLMNGEHIRGRARGNWFFEGSFSGEIVDANGKHLGTVIITAPGNWMTSEFVRFIGDVLFSTPSTPTGKLKLHNANPSGLPENEKVLVIPVNFY